MVNAVKAKKPAAGGKKKAKHPLNAILGAGVMRYSKSKMYQRRSLYRLKGVKRPVVKKEKVPIKKVKKIKGPKNGGERAVSLQKPKADYPTKAQVKKRPTRSTFNAHIRYVRRSLKPGRILILLAGRHQGKRVVLLKVLKTGLLLVTGPYQVNGCPLRRISQRYVIACQTRLNLSKYNVPEHLDDKYFRRVINKTKKGAESDIFAAKKVKYVPTEQRKADQKAVDEAVLKVIKKTKEGKFIVKYLKSMFSLRTTQYPHRMTF